MARTPAASFTYAKTRRLPPHLLEHGITFLDTADFYVSGHNELLIGKAIAGRRDKVQLHGAAQ
jgi:aryl-alcohol dehydrogenase-like predicted oxidoreductase